MAKVLTEATKLGNDTLKAVKDVLSSPKGLVDGIKKGGTPVKESVGSKVLGGVGEAMLWPVKKAGSVALWTIEQPIAYGIKAVRYGVKGVGGAYRKAPLIMVPLTAVAGIAAYSSHARHKAEARTKAEQDAQFAAIEAQVLGGQQQVPQPQAIATTYQVTPEEAAILEQRMKGGQGAQGGHADSIVAAREAAAAQQQPQPTASL